ncbi:MAG: hypothetical protein SFY70_06335 [Bacteroidia bacterium]|nr:hypothetical protein [Bacteroidia bacterium]
MRIAIVEYQVPGHDLVADALCRMAASVPGAEVTLVISPASRERFEGLLAERPNVTLRVGPSTDPTPALRQLAREGYGRVVLCTVERDFAAYARVPWRCPVDLLVHNTDRWFEHSVQNGWARFSATVPPRAWLAPVARYHLKQAFLYPLQRGAVLRAVARSGGRLLVSSPAMAQELQRVRPNGMPTVLPFTVHCLPGPGTAAGGPLRLCVPGSVSAQRRDYAVLFRLLDRLPDLRGQFELDLLGRVQATEGAHPILAQVAAYRAQGFAIRQYEAPLSNAAYDTELAQAGAVLSLARTGQARGSRYGHTTESGTVHMAIRAGVPLLVGSSYPDLAGYEAAALRYSTEAELEALVRQLLTDPGFRAAAQTRARAAAGAFAPHVWGSTLAGA